MAIARRMTPKNFLIAIRPDTPMTRCTLLSDFNTIYTMIRLAKIATRITNSFFPLVS
jgi:hypothetical protein